MGVAFIAAGVGGADNVFAVDGQAPGASSQEVPLSLSKALENVTEPYTPGADRPRLRRSYRMRKHPGAPEDPGHRLPARKSDSLPVKAPEPADGRGMDEGDGSSIPPLRFTGYYKFLGIRSQTPDDAQDRYNLGLNRLRLKLTYSPFPWVRLHAENDTELRVGSYIDKAEFRRQETAPPVQYWKAQSNLSEGNNYYLTNNFFRGYVKFLLEGTDVTVGRQRIPLGAGRNWSTLDMLNPVNPLQVEREEYVGVDAALVEQKIGALSKLMWVYAPDPARKSSRWIVRYRANYEATDWALTYGKYWDDRIAGVDVVSQLGDAGLRGEWTYARPQVGPSYQKALLGFDYGFVNTLTLSMELYYSGQSMEERLAAFARNPQLARVESFGDRNGGLTVNYEITPLLEAVAYVLLNLKDHSRFVSPALSYSLSENLSVSGGAQFFSGNAGSEYGSGKDLYYMQLERFF
jgi:hypothetical protein